MMLVNRTNNMGRLWEVVLFVLSYVDLARAQFPPTPQDVRILNSRYEDGVYISYKEVRIPYYLNTFE